MNIGILLQMAADGFSGRVAFGRRSDGLTYGELLDRARRTGAWLSERGVERVDLVDLNSEAVPILLFGAAFAGVPFVPLNYRLSDEQLRAILARTAPAVAVVDPPAGARVDGTAGIELVTRADFLATVADPACAALEEAAAEPDEVAVLLFTSGTTGEPKAAVLRHRHLSSYVFTTVDFGGAGEDEAALVSVPPYHIAGVSAVLTSVFAGRRVVQLASFDPEEWVRTVVEEGVTQAMVVPTMLRRILDVIERDQVSLPTLRAIAYGGGKMALPDVERALAALPAVDFVNAYGLTETSSTVAVLGPEDHRTAWASDDPEVRLRLGSVGRPLPTVELEVHDEDGRPVGPGVRGEIVVRGEQVAGEYLDRESGGGWFRTRDTGYLDAEGYLFIEGRMDDVIVRGGENMSPGEIEEVLLSHPAVSEAAVVGLPDAEWGECVAAAVVLADGTSATEQDLQEWVRQRLRSSRMPQRIAFVGELPYSDTGKLLRRVVRADLATDAKDVAR